MNKIKISHWSEIPTYFTGVAEYADGYKEGSFHRRNGPAIEHINGSKLWYKDGDRHREDGPACEYADGYKEWYLNNVCYKQIFLGDNVILDSYQGEYNLIWFKLLGKYKVFEYPDIPGLIIK